jgi:hypothetical protein
MGKITHGHRHNMDMDKSRENKQRSETGTQTDRDRDTMDRDRDTIPDGRLTALHSLPITNANIVYQVNLGAPKRRSRQVGSSPKKMKSNQGEHGAIYIKKR